MLNRLTLQQLHAFERVASLGGFRAAAEQLHVSPPALSRTIRVTEDLVGARLFDRDTRHVHLTAAGAELLPIAQRILHEFHHASSDLSEFLSGTRGLIRIGVLPSAGTTVLPQAMRHFRAAHPGVRFDMLEAAAQPLEQLLLSSRIDFALTAAPQPRAEFSFTPWMRDPLVLLCARTHAFARRKAVQWRMLASQTLIDFSPRSSIQPLIDGALAQLGVDIAEHLASSSIATCCAMVAEDMGVAIVPQLALELCGVRAFERVCAIPLREPVVPRDVGVLQLAGRTLSPACARFMDELKSQLAAQLAELRGPWQLPAR